MARVGESGEFGMLKQEVILRAVDELISQSNRDKTPAVEVAAPVSKSKDEERQERSPQRKKSH